MAYLSLAEFTARTLMPSEHVSELETRYPGWTDAQLQSASEWLNARLRKRYAVPFATPTEDVKAWVTRLVTLRCYLKRGVDPDDLQFVEIKADYDSAKTEILEAANSETGLFDLPLLTSTDASAIARGMPMVYSEQSPYVWTDVQGDIGRLENMNRRGSSG